MSWGGIIFPDVIKILVNYHGPLGPAPPAMCYYPLSIIHNVIINTCCLATITAFSLGNMFIIIPQDVDLPNAVNGKLLFAWS